MKGSAATARVRRATQLNHFSLSRRTGKTSPSEPTATRTPPEHAANTKPINDLSQQVEQAPQDAALAAHGAVLKQKAGVAHTERGATSRTVRKPSVQSGLA
jgi:hypothetical protein